MDLRFRYTFYIDAQLARGLKALKAKTGISESEAIRRAIAGYLLREGIVGPKRAASSRAATQRKT